MRFQNLRFFGSHNRAKRVVYQLVKCILNHPLNSFNALIINGFLITGVPPNREVPTHLIYILQLATFS